MTLPLSGQRIRTVIFSPMSMRLFHKRRPGRPPGKLAAPSTPGERLMYICDWLPPDYGAVGQYSLLFARELAAQGRDITLVGLSSEAASETVQNCGCGSLRILKIKASSLEKSSHFKRAIWTFGANTRLLWHSRHHLRTVDTILFTGSPPMMIHWLGPLNLILRRKLVYRITDFHPECAIAQRSKPGMALRLLLPITVFWRRRVDEFEVLGYDQTERLTAIGIDRNRIRLKRDPSPVQISPGTIPLERPDIGPDQLLLLYSGNWGVAHDYETFIGGYLKHHTIGTGRFVLWLNAVGTAAERVAKRLRRHGVPFVSGSPVPLGQLASLLVTPDAHLITLRDEFVGYVLPSKVHGCVESRRPVIFIGSHRSDVHLLCQESLQAPYERVDVGDAEGCWQSLERLAAQIAATK